MDPTILIGGVVVVALIAGIVVVVINFIPRASTGNVQARLDDFAQRETPLSLEEIELSLPFSERVILPLLQQISEAVSKFMPKHTMEKTRRDIEMAGRPIKSPEMFFGIKAVAAVVLTGHTVVISMLGAPIFLIPLGTLFGFILPGVWLGGKIKARQEEIVKTLPDVLDLLRIAVEAGLGFEAAMAKVAEKWDNQIAKAFTRVLQEIRLGKPRVEAMREMELNMGVPDMTSFVAAVIQATTFGVSISQVLQIQSDQMRTRRRQRAEQKAQQAPIKMLFPMVFLIFPALFIVLLGPAALLIIESGVVGQFA